MSIWPFIALIAAGAFIFSIAFVFLGFAAKKDQTGFRLITVGTLGLLVSLLVLVSSVVMAIVEARGSGN
jgi:uncharacterized membrane protein HdeD (DUF308 family)